MTISGQVPLPKRFIGEGSYVFVVGGWPNSSKPEDNTGSASSIDNDRRNHRARLGVQS
jgi:hypothetical protein